MPHRVATPSARLLSPLFDALDALMDAVDVAVDTSDQGSVLQIVALVRVIASIVDSVPRDITDVGATAFADGTNVRPS
jgi:hypothetical protein